MNDGLIYCKMTIKLYEQTIKYVKNAQKIKGMTRTIFIKTWHFVVVKIWHF